MDILVRALVQLLASLQMLGQTASWHVGENHDAKLLMRQGNLLQRLLQPTESPYRRFTD
jgi:hypothetical protein